MAPLRKKRGVKRVVVEIAHDYDAGSPLQNDYVGCTLDSFVGRHNQKEPTEFFAKDDEGNIYPRTKRLMDDLRTGRAFVLHYYEHGLGEWTLQNEGMGCQFDSNNFAGLLQFNEEFELPASYKEREEFARYLLREYTAWWNGTVYQFRIHGLDDDHYVAWFSRFYDVKYLVETIREKLGNVTDFDIVGEAADVVDVDMIPPYRPDEP